MSIRKNPSELRRLRAAHVGSCVLALQLVGCGSSDDAISDLFVLPSDAGKDTSLAPDGAGQAGGGAGHLAVTTDALEDTPTPPIGDTNQDRPREPDDGSDARPDADAPEGEGIRDPCANRPDNTACSMPDAPSRICKSLQCARCSPVADDSNCTSAYGAGATAYICTPDGCTPGECRVDGDCAVANKAGRICALDAPHQCAKCRTDAQCQASSYGAGTICNVAAGTCVPAACSPTQQACSANTADFCCGAGAATSGACVAGNCCPIAGVPRGTCPTASDVCRNNTCTTCPAVTNNTYYVDPVAGADTGPTGATSCPFKTISRAAQYIVALAGTPGSVPAGTKILLRSKSNAASGEHFPITIPPNVTLSSEVASSPQVIEVATDTNGVALVAPNSGLANIILDGLTTALSGIVVGAGQIAGISFTPSKDTTTISNVTVTTMRNDGVDVESGGVLIRQGVSSTGNGTNPTNNGLGSGLHVAGGVAVVTVNAAEPTAAFNENQGNGIYVQNGGQILLTGRPDITGYPAIASPPAVLNGVGTVTANGNMLANLAIVQSGATPPHCVIDGLVTWKGSGNGMALVAGSNVTVHNSVSTGNAGSGVAIKANGTSSVANINLGSDAFGHNILQAASGSANKSAGICMGNFFNVDLTLLAKGNYFNGKDCSVVSAPKTTVNGSRVGCANAIDVGAELWGNTQQNNVKVALDNCQSF